MPNLCDEIRPDVWPSRNRISFDPSEIAQAGQSTNFQLQTNIAAPGSGYGASNLYGDEIGASGCIRPVSAAVLKTNGLETIAKRDCEEVCTTLFDEPSPQFTPDPTSFEASKNDCACITCLKILPHRGQSLNSGETFKCHFPSCPKTSRTDLWYHETSHYGKYGKFTCLEQKCQVSTRLFSDLRRHYKTHCTSPDKEIFSCPVSWCKYSGNNGFVRKDKLKSHYRNIHEGKPGPLKAGRVIKPATLKPQVSSAEIGPSKRNE